METEQGGEQSALQIGREQIVAMVTAFIEGTERDVDSQREQPGPWDPVVRVAVEQVRLFALARGNATGWGGDSDSTRGAQDLRELLFAPNAGRTSEPRSGTTGGIWPGDEVALNPQPLPPRYALFVAATQAVVRRAQLLEELSIASPDVSSGTAVEAYIRRFIDDWCRDDFTFRWPSPGQRPRWFPLQPDGVDLIVVATQLRSASSETFGPDLRETLATASESFLDEGLRRLQETLDNRGLGTW